MKNKLPLIIDLIPMGAFALPSLITTVAIIIAGSPHAHAIYNILNDKIFQIELLNDCSIYVYDRVLISQWPEGWCNDDPSYMQAIPYTHDGVVYVGIYAYFVDDNSMLHIGFMATNSNESKEDELMPQAYCEATADGRYEGVSSNSSVPHETTFQGRYAMTNVIFNHFYDFIYTSCNLEPPKKSIVQRVQYEESNKIVTITKMPTKCDPNVIFEDQKNEIKIYIDPDKSDVMHCAVKDAKVVLGRQRDSVLTNVLAYSMIPDFAAAFPISFVTPLSKKTNHEYSGVFIMDDRKLSSTNGEVFWRPPIAHQYNEIPFFFNSESKGLYFSLFLYYKYDGGSRDFTVRFVHNGQYYQLFNPIKYMDKCEFKNESTTVIAAPRLTAHTEEMLQFEVYFLLNNNDFQYCIYDVVFRYKGENCTSSVTPSSDGVYPFVHVKTLSTTAVNCIGREPHRYLLAYTENKVAELVNLDSGISSPIFPCPSCGPKTLMTCETPDQIALKNYDSAVYLITGKEVQYVGVKYDGNYSYKSTLEYLNKTMDANYYFLQDPTFKLSVNPIYDNLEKADVFIDPIFATEKSLNSCNKHYLYGVWAFSMLYIVLMYIFDSTDY